MENNTENNVESNMVSNVEKKNNNLIMAIIIIIIILAVISLIYVKKLNIQNRQISPTETDKQLDQAVASDTTVSINDSINSINLDDTSDTDLIPVDQELQKL